MLFRQANFFSKSLHAGIATESRQLRIREVSPDARSTEVSSHAVEGFERTIPVIEPSINESLDVRPVSRCGGRNFLRPVPTAGPCIHPTEEALIRVLIFCQELNCLLQSSLSDSST